MKLKITTIETPGKITPKAITVREPLVEDFMEAQKHGDNMKMTAALVAAIVVCWNQFAGFRAFIYTMWDAIKGFGEAIIGWVIAPFKAAGEIVMGLAKAVGAFLSGDFGGSFDALTEGAKGAAAAFTDPINLAIDTAQAIGGNYDKNLAAEQDKEAKAKAEKKAKPAAIDGAPGFDFPGMPDNGAGEMAIPAGGLGITGYAMPQGAAAENPLAGAMATPAIGGGAMGAAPAAPNVNVTFNPTVNISGDMTAKSREDFMALLRSYGADIARLVSEETRKLERGSYAVSAAR